MLSLGVDDQGVVRMCPERPFPLVITDKWHFVNNDQQTCCCCPEGGWGTNAVETGVGGNAACAMFGYHLIPPGSEPLPLGQSVRSDIVPLHSHLAWRHLEVEQQQYYVDPVSYTHLTLPTKA